MMEVQVLKLCFVSVLFASIQSESEVPVLMWGTGVSLLDPPSPLLKFDSELFYRTVLKKLVSYSPPTIAIFIEKSLSTEDFRWKDSIGEGSYPSLKETAKVDGVKFYPYVQDALKALKTLQSENYQIRMYNRESENEDVNEIAKADLPINTNNVLMIDLNDAQIGEDRPDLLRKHDRYIKDVCDNIEQKYGKVICILTAHNPSWTQPESLSRKLRSVDNDENASSDKQQQNDDPNLNNVFRAQKFGMIYTKSAPILNDAANNKTYELIFEPSMGATGDKTKNQLSVPFHLNGTSPKQVVWVRFRFIVEYPKWKVKEVVFSQGTTQQTLTTKSNIATSKGYSFHTPLAVVFKTTDSPTYQLTFRNLQIEYFFEEDKKSFSMADDTVTFFTIPILTGLVVTILLATIVLFGLSMIFDIKTMDQFDDPKGKTVTINASE